MRNLINIVSLSEADPLKQQVISAVKSTNDDAVLQRVLKTLKAGNIEDRIKDVLEKDADAKRFIDKLAEVIVAIKAPIEEKNKFLASLNLNVMSRWYSKAI